MAGLLTEAVSWRALFGLQVLVGAGLVLLGWRKVDNQAVGEPESFDTTGLVVLMVGLTALLVSLMQALTWGWDSAATLSLFGVGLAVLAAFAGFELRRAHPLLDVGLPRKRTCAASSWRCSPRSSSSTATSSTSPPTSSTCLATVRCWPRWRSSPRCSPSPSSTSSPAAPPDRIGARTPALFGYLLTAVCMGWIGRLRR